MYRFGVLCTRRDLRTPLNRLTSINASRSKHSLPFATVNVDDLSGSQPAQVHNLVQGNWTKSSKWNTLVDPLNGKPFIKVSEIDEQGVQPFVDSLSSCPKHGLHNPFKAPERYLLYGDITAKAAHMLSLPEVSDFFTRLIQRVAPKSYQQAFGEVYVTQKFLENFCGDQVRFLARSFAIPGNHLGQQSHGFRWPYGPVAIITPFNFPLEIPVLQLMGALYMGNKPVLKVDSKVCIVMEQMLRLLHECGLPMEDVKGKVLSVQPLSMRIEVTLRTTSTTKASNYGMADFNSIHVGNIISGKVKRIESYGLFITIDQTNMVGLCHLSQLPEEHIEDLEAKYKAGDKVTAKILKVDEDRRRISLGMKDSDPKDNTDIQPPSNRMSGDVSEDDLLLKGEHLMSDDASDVPPVLCQVESRASVLPKVESRASVLSKVESRASVLPLEVTLDDAENSPVSHADGQRLEEVDNIDIVNQKNKKLAKKKAKEEREREISAAEERLIQEDIPRTADEFEKLIRNSPNSSFLWIKYMEFMISLSDVDKARSIAERALRTINIREESEKLNIWVAYFNLENEYGNPPEDAVVKIFQRALQYCDPKKVHLALLGVYERTERPEQQKMANELIDKMVKKFKHSCKVWLRRIQILLKQKQDGVQPLVNRALLSLPRHKHIKFISQAAILEFKGGVPDRGRSMFEGMLKEYPKRTDLWSIYLDQEIRLGDMDVIRSLFERAISLSLPPKKMKFLFKKYLEYEKSLGDEDRIEYVKRKAMEYVESTIA